MPEKPENKKFEELLSRLIENEISEEQIKELTILVKTTPSFSQQLRDQLLMDSRLVQYENPSHSAEAFIRNLEQVIEAEENGNEFVDRVIDFLEEQSPAHPPTQQQRRFHWLISATAVAACFLFVFLWKPAGIGPLDQNMENGVAVVTTVTGDQTTQLLEGTTLTPGIFEIKSGYVMLEFFSGARVSIAGPAKLDLIDTSNIFCYAGKLRAQVPVVAQGFTVKTPGSDLVDLGTEFGVDVNNQGETQIHVFDGLVDAYDTQQSPDSLKRLTAGAAMKIPEYGEWENLQVNDQHFDDLVRVNDFEDKENIDTFNKWKELNQELRTDDRLIAYYDFQPDPTNERILKNRAQTGDQLDGAIVGAKWSEGPWGDKKSISFKRPGDRIRIRIPGKYESVTLSAWILVDGLDRSYNSFLLTDGFENGEIHWQLFQEGGIDTGIKHSNATKISYRTEPFVDLKTLGHWVHLVTVIDSENDQLRHYLNGKLWEVNKLRERELLRFGDSSIGNWYNPVTNSPYKIRNLNGRIAEMMLFNTALDESEISRLALNAL